MTSKETLSTILCGCLIVGNKMELFKNDTQQWECLTQGARLSCFIEWLSPLSPLLKRWKSLELTEVLKLNKVIHSGNKDKQVERIMS